MSNRNQQNRGRDPQQGQRRGGGFPGGPRDNQQRFEEVKNRPSRLMYISDDITDEALDIVQRMDGRFRSMQKRHLPHHVRRELKAKFQQAVSSFATAISKLAPEANGKNRDGGRRGGGQNRQQPQKNKAQQQGQGQNNKQDKSRTPAPAAATAAPASQGSEAPAGGAAPAGEVVKLDTKGQPPANPAGEAKVEKKTTKSRARKAG